MAIAVQASPEVRIRQDVWVWSAILLGYLLVWSIPLFIPYSGKGEGTIAAEAALRDPGLFKWYIIPILLVIFNAYADELRAGNLAGVWAGVAFFLWDMFNEIWNGFFHTATGGYAAVWMCNFPTAWQPLMGWNIEILFMFLLMGIASTKILPEDRHETWFGINNRHVIAAGMAVFCVVVEILLNLWGALVWNYSWWNPKFPFLVFLIGYLPFWEIAFYVHDLPGNRERIRVVAGLFTFNLLLLSVGLSKGWL